MSAEELVLDIIVKDQVRMARFRGLLYDELKGHRTIYLTEDGNYIQYNNEANHWLFQYDKETRYLTTGPYLDKKFVDFTDFDEGYYFDYTRYLDRNEYYSLFKSIVFELYGLTVNRIE